MAKVLVVGSSGTVGSELVKVLRAKGHEVRQTTSRAADKPDQVSLDLRKLTGLDKAFQGIDRAFLLCPPGITNQDAVIGALIQSAVEHKLKKVVLMTAMGADADANSAFRKAETKLEKSGLHYNIIRPNWFMQNFNSYWIQGILSAQKIFLPVGKAKGSFIDTRDIASTAAALLEPGHFDNQAFDLTGPEAIDHDQVAAILSRVTEKTITYQEVTPEEMRGSLLGAGMPADYTEMLLAILGFFKLGYAERTTNAVEQVTGHKPISFEKYAHDYRQAWLAAGSHDAR